jgi:hypothetical protein
VKRDKPNPLTQGLAPSSRPHPYEIEEWLLPNGRVYRVLAR